MGMNIRRLSIFSLLVATTFTAAAACRPNSSAGEPAVTAAVTIYPVEFFTRQIGGDRVNVVTLIPAGTDAHDFEPTPAHIRTIAESDLVLFNHPGFESWIVDAIEAAGPGIPFAQLADLSDDADASPDPAAESDPEVHEHDGGVDPHVWLNPLEAVTMVNRARDALSSVDPEGAAEYSANAAALVAKLGLLDDSFSKGLSNCEHSVFVASHLAYGHLAERYELEQLALAGLSDEAEPSPQHIASIISEIRQLGLEALLVEPYSNQDLAETVARETGAQLLPLHPLESLTRAEQDAGDDYFTVMQRNLVSLRSALDCSG